ncbi:MAG: tetratricopeptide repeat protein, partial [Ignavibacteriaceae bacterium]
MVKKFFFVFVLLFLIPSFPQSLSQNEIDLNFKKAVNLFDILKYEQALTEFNKIIDGKYNSKTTISFLFKGKTLLKLKRNKDAINILEKFIQSYPNSMYEDEARLTLAKALLEEKKYLDAFKDCLQIISQTSKIFYEKTSKDLGKKIASSYLTSTQINPLIKEYEESKIKSYLYLIAGKIYKKEGNFKEAESLFNKILLSYSDSEENEEAVRLQKESLSSNLNFTDSNIIGILLPLSGENVTSQTSNSAKEILEGIKFAVSEFNKDRKEKAGILIRNTEMSDIKIQEIKNEFKSIPQVKAVIGPIYSQEVREAVKDFK